MQNYKVIALGVPPFLLHAITHMVGNLEITFVSTFDELSTAEADIYFVDALTFITQPDFFLPKKPKTVLWFNQPRPDNFQSPDLNILFNYDAEERILSLLTQVQRNVSIERAENIEDKRELSSRERDVLREIASGKTNKEIADSLFISVNTVITHRKNLTAKLGIRSVSGLSLYALMNGII